MREWPVVIVSAFGRGETLAQALHENGFKVQVLDFTPAFAADFHRGVGPFPIVNNTYIPAQRDLLKQLVPLSHGLNLWLSDGPMDLTGPFESLHATSHPDWAKDEFSSAWVERWLRQWTAPFFSESWTGASDPAFPSREPLGLLPLEQEERMVGFMRSMSKGVTVRSCTHLHDLRAESSRLQELEVECGSRLAASASQWVWCLSSHETQMLNENVARTMFWRGVMTPEWTWISLDGTMKSGPWCDGLPTYSVVIGDIFLPWAYANTFVLRRLEGTRFRVWLKVPFERASHIDARRGWALGAENLLRARLPLADWSIDSGAWSRCPNSEVFPSSLRGELPGQWKNWDWISSETLPRLDLSARLEREATSFNRLIGWRNDQIKKQGVQRDHALHAP